MKKITVMILTLAMLLSLTACDNSENLSDSGGSSEVDSRNMGNSENSYSSENSDDISDSEPVRPKPDGEPTFLICPDGEPVYTSEITQFLKLENYKYVPDEEGGLDDFDKLECDGFAYAYIPRACVNFIENPEKFKPNINGNGEITGYTYHGRELSDSSEFFRVYVGDKFGPLTVVSAKTAFKDSYYDSEDGHFAGCELILEGELELTGYAEVSEESQLYPGNGGIIQFFPDSESSTKLPNVLFQRNGRTKKVEHLITAPFKGWYQEGGSEGFLVGNINDFESGLREGDIYIPTKITVERVLMRSDSYEGRSYEFTLKSVEKI